MIFLTVLAFKLELRLIFLLQGLDHHNYCSQLYVAEAVKNVHFTSSLNNYGLYLLCCNLYFASVCSVCTAINVASAICLTFPLLFQHFSIVRLTHCPKHFSGEFIVQLLYVFTYLKYSTSSSACNNTLLLPNVTFLCRVSSCFTQWLSLFV